MYKSVCIYIFFREILLDVSVYKIIVLIKFKLERGNIYIVNVFSILILNN